MTITLTTILAALLSLATNSLFAADGHVHGGGGGVISGEGFVTFYQGGFSIRKDVTPINMSDIPGYNELFTIIDGMLIEPEYKGMIKAALIPDSQRKYSWIDELSEPERQRIIAAYFAELDQTPPPENVVIYALTSRKSRQTYFLPAFQGLIAQYQRQKDAGLPEAQKSLQTIQVILMHEVRWLLSPNLTYRMNMFQDQAFQIYLETGYSQGFYRDLAEFFKNPWISILAAIKEEQRRLQEYAPKDMRVYEFMPCKTSGEGCKLLLESWTDVQSAWFERFRIAKITMDNALDIQLIPLSHFLGTKIRLGARGEIPNGAISATSNRDWYDRMIGNLASLSSNRERKFIIFDPSNVQRSAVHLSGWLRANSDQSIDLVRLNSDGVWVVHPTGAYIATNRLPYKWFSRTVDRLYVQELLYYKHRVKVLYGDGHGVMDRLSKPLLGCDYDKSIATYGYNICIEAESGDGPGVPNYEKPVVVPKPDERKPDDSARICECRFDYRPNGDVLVNFVIWNGLGEKIVPQPFPETMSEVRCEILLKQYLKENLCVTRDTFLNQ